MPRQACPTFAVALFCKFSRESMLSLKLLDKIIPALLANCLINNFSIMYKFKQDLAMAYFPDHSKESASKRFAHRLLPPPQNPLPKTNPNHLLLPRRTLKAHHQRPPNPLPSTQPRARPPASPSLISILSTNTKIISTLSPNTIIFTT